MQQLKNLSFSFFLFVLVSCKTTGEKTTSLSKSEYVYPDSDLLQIEDFTKAVKAQPTLRAPADQALKLPHDLKTGELFSVIKEPTLLLALEKKGFNLLNLLEPEKDQAFLRATSSDVFSNASLLSQSSKYQSIYSTIEQDLNELLVSEKEKMGLGAVGVGIKYPYRVFDVNWLKSKISNFQLIGIVNRVDRVSFNSKSCGEIRFIFRLGYDQGVKGIQSRLPMTLMIKYELPGAANTAAEWNKCKRYIASWRYPEENLTPDQLLNWMSSPSGPLSADVYKPEILKTVEINMQALRIPSSMRPEFGGHGNYLLRAFKPHQNILVPTVLENTPDVDKILGNPELLAKLKKLMKERTVVNRIQAGIYRLDDEFLATKAFSFSPMGLSRQDNRPFNKLLTVSDFEVQDFTRNPYVKSPDSAIRRLNDLSCVGCHQGRATAGFHFLGIDRSDVHAFNALQFEGSGHFQLELIRRSEFMNEALKKFGNVEPNRDFSYAPPAGRKAGQGHFCGLPPANDFSHWQCEDGLQCMRVDGTEKDQALGKCFPKVLTAGSPCVVGVVSQVNHRKDALISQKALRCGDGKRRYGCSEVKGGFPSGMCNTPCNSLNSNEVCAQIAGANFTQCVATGRPFEECLDGSAKSGRGVCNDSIVCRNDYVCSRTFGNPNGNCTPAYFLFQIRLDGHPEPEL